MPSSKNQVMVSSNPLQNQQPDSKFGAEKLLTRAGLAKELGRSVSWVDKWKGKLFPVIPQGPRCQVFLKSDVIKALLLGPGWKADPDLCQRYGLNSQNGSTDEALCAAEATRRTATAHCINGFSEYAH